MFILRSMRDKLFLRKHLNQPLTSEKLRSFFIERYQIDIGLYSYGCFDASRIARGTSIGRYCSFSNSAHILNGNHGIDFLSTHPYLFNVQLGCVDQETINRAKCSVEDDVWIGHSAIILPKTVVIGRGSVIAAGAVVTRSVPRYAIVAGNPAQIKRFRFSEKIIERIEETEWWKMSCTELKELMKQKQDMVFNPANYFMSRNELK